MSDETGTAALTATLKAGSDYSAPWIVVRADTPEDFKTRLEALTALDLHATTVSAAQALQAVWAVASGLGGTVIPDPTPAPAAAPAAPQAEAYAAPAPPAPAATGAPAPQCVHGTMVHRASKPGAAKAWSGWFCPTPKGTVGQCDPKWDPR